MKLNQQQFTLDILKSPIPSLANFVLSNVPQLESVCVRTILEKISSYWHAGKTIPPELNLIYLWGANGSGKSHLLKALFEEAKGANLPTIFLTPSSPLWSTLQTAPQKLAYLIDDIHLLNSTELSQLFKLMIDTKSSPEILLCISGAHSIKGLHIREDVSSRLASGINFSLQILSDTEKICAIQEAALARGLHLSDDIAPWLLKNCPRDLPSLINILEVLDQYSLQTKRPINLSLLRDLFNPN